MGLVALCGDRKRVLNAERGALARAMPELREPRAGPQTGVFPPAGCLSASTRAAVRSGDGAFAGTLGVPRSAAAAPRTLDRLTGSTPASITPGCSHAPAGGPARRVAPCRPAEQPSACQGRIAHHPFRREQTPPRFPPRATATKPERAARSPRSSSSRARALCPLLRVPSSWTPGTDPESPGTDPKPSSEHVTSGGGPAKTTASLRRPPATLGHALAGGRRRTTHRTRTPAPAVDTYR